jgi:predicted GIY-YIG superfamily endonuclease
MPRSVPLTTATYCVYLLGCLTLTRTYTGCTNNLRRRLRQHNGEISGGARSTRGQRWYVHASVHGFASAREALRFEYYSKRPHLLRPGACEWPVPPAQRRRVSGVERRAALLEAMAATAPHLLVAVQQQPQ